MRQKENIYYTYVCVRKKTLSIIFKHLQWIEFNIGFLFSYCEHSVKWKMQMPVENICLTFVLIVFFMSLCFDWYTIMSSVQIVLEVGWEHAQGPRQIENDNFVLFFGSFSLFPSFCGVYEYYLSVC